MRINEMVEAGLKPRDRSVIQRELATENGKHRESANWNATGQSLSARRRPAPTPHEVRGPLRLPTDSRRSVLLEVPQHPRSDIRAAIIEAITTATDERLRSEADREGAEVISEVRRPHPEWRRAMPDTGREATCRTYWTKKFWREAMEHHAPS
ncbi:hypothetical protein [Streptomyces sp. NBC_00076]|uniref:hypothetical protein n=1 Tax=Streptomyces sp. NBC_00076 TaxID=2975642 RepID=UPI00324C1A4B